jgi:outer membrane protein assembly factor BamB
LSIVAVCPHCETQFTLSPDLAGKAMRCPNPDCREVFTVAEVGAAPAPEAIPPEPKPSSAPTVAANSGLLTDFVPVLEVEAVLPAPALEVERIDPEPFRFAPEPAPVRVVPPLLQATLLPPIPPTTTAHAAGPKEVKWNASLETPAVKAGPVVPARPAPNKDDDELAAAIAARKLAQRRINPRRVLYVILAGIVLFGAGAVIKVVWFNAKTEEKLAQEAKEEYGKSNYAPAVEKYEQLLARFPESASRDEYEFFLALAKVRGAVSSVVVADNPYPAVKSYREFVETYGTSPFAKPDGGPNSIDVLETGKQAVDGLIACGNERLKAFRSEGRQKPEQLDDADKAVVAAKELLPTVEGFRDKDTPPLDAQRTGMAKAAGEIAAERHRLAVLAPYRGLPEDPTDERIVRFEAVLKKEKLDADEEAKVIVNRAKSALRGLVRPERQNIPAGSAPGDAAPSFVPVAAVETPPGPPGSERKSAGAEVFFARARGILFAFDADTGQPLWQARVSSATANPFSSDLPTRARSVDGDSEIVVVASDLGLSPALTARDARTGEALWHQPLEAPVAGRPVVVKRRVYAPLRDPFGTVAEFDLTDGTRIGQIRLRQPIGPGASLRPGTGLLYVAAEARRVFVLDVDARDVDGNRQPARCVQIVPTEHASDTLRGPPVVVGPPGVGPAPRFLVVLQSDGPAGMKLRAYPVADPPRVVDPAAPIPELPFAPPAVETTIAGWATFAPASDGERCAVVTDRGVFAEFGVNQLSNADDAVFRIPVTYVPTVKPGSAVPGQVVLADEDSTWVLAGGDLVRLRLAVDIKDGWKLIPAGLPRPLGEPLHRPQVNARRDLVMVTVRSPASGACRAVCFDPRDGRIAWQRQLGAVPLTAPIATTAGVLIPDEDGGAVRLDPKAAVSGTKPIAADAAVCPPVPRPAGPAAAAANDKAAWFLVPEWGEGDSTLLRIRSVVAGALATNTAVPLPAALAGAPLALGEALFLPLADGLVYRFVPGADKLVPGQSWKADGAAAEATCFLAAGDGDTFYATDGNDRFRGWSWPADPDAKMASATGLWDGIGPIVLPPVLAAGKDGKKLLIVADAGGFAAYSPDHTGEPIRKWRCGKELPAGKPTQGPIPIPGTTRILFGVGGRHVVALQPDADAPAWVSSPKNLADPGGELIGLSTDGSKVYATTAAGFIRVLKADTGTPLGDPVSAGIPGALPSPHGTATPFGPNMLVVPMIDGTVVVVFVP